MFILKRLKTLQHVSIIFRKLICSLLKTLILKFVKNVKSQCGDAGQHNIWCVSCVERCAVQHTSPHRTHALDCSPAHLSTQDTHQMLCCRITTLTFYIFNKF